ncbi:hypothetical protein [Pontibacter saemangeumensis]
MKKTYAILLSGAMLMSAGLTGCSSENTTGVDTETNANEVDGQLNDPDEGPVTEENVSPLDTANGGAGADMNGNSNSGTGDETNRTTTPGTDSGN